MGRKKSKGNPPPKFATKSGTWHEHFTPFFDNMLNSKAYIALSATSKEAYMILRQEYKGDNYTPHIICPYKTFKAKGMRPNTVSRALVQLVAFGFIEYEPGGLAHKPNVYHLTEGWKKINTDEEVENAMEEFKLKLGKRSVSANNIAAM